MDHQVITQSVPAGAVDAAPPASRPGTARRRARLPGLAIAGVVVVCLVSVAVFEIRTSTIEGLALATYDRGIGFAVEPGPGPGLRAPDGGPYDVRLGYARLPELDARLRSAGYTVVAQARPSPRLRAAVERGLFPIYREKSRAGLRLIDRAARLLYEAPFPERVYGAFGAVPPPVVDALLFVENRGLLDERRPHLNPAVEWPRLARAVNVEVRNRFGRHGPVIGASTLATQIEKFRHSPDGRTRSQREKLRQMLSASLRAYLDGPDTLARRRRIVVDYLDSIPLAAAPGHGEVLGLGDGLWAWYGMDFEETNRLLAGDAAAAARARAYKRVLSLLLSARRPYFYLTENRRALEDFTNGYLRVMARAGVIDARLRDAALAQALDFRRASPPPAVDFSDRKAATLVRTRLAGLLGVPALYDLDRLDLTARSTLDGPVQDVVSRTLEALEEPGTVEALGLKGWHLLERGDPARVIYSFTLYERGPRANLLRVQTDSLDQPLDINAGARLDLGSTAKLRTLIGYLETVAGLHARYGRATPAELRAVSVHPRDRLTAWAIEYLARTPGAALGPMLDAAMERRYSASPAEAFATGGGLQTFHNFDRDDDTRILSVREGFRRSVNLVFIRLMRDIVDHRLYGPPASLARVLEDRDDPRRQAFLVRFADREGSEFIRRFFRKYEGKSPDEVLDLALGTARQSPVALATVLRSVDPDADVDELATILDARLPRVSLPFPRVEALHDKHAPAALSLVDRGFLARLHPLELWVAAYLHRHPDADLATVLALSAGERQAVYGWLFRTEHRHAQDKRIRSLLEVQVFLDIQRDWQRLGYPFASLTPSLATAIGSSGDRPAALARLMGIIANGGLSNPTVLLPEVELGVGTPYETRWRRVDADGERVMTAEVAAEARRALVDVVMQGTARGLREALRRPDGGAHVVGGKTGTGDHRYDTFGPGGRLVESRVVDRAATFAFLIDDRFFGTVTAYVAGPKAAQYEFTSALPVRVLGLLMPVLSPLIDAGPAAPAAVPATPPPAP
jgi:membrane peptidoglycan carboxypeptidase